MQDFLRQLPSVLILGALVAIFLSLQRRKESLRIRYWQVGWGFMLLHFVASLLEFSPRAAHVEAFLELGSLQLAGIAFLASVAGFLYRTTRRYLLILCVAVPATLYVALMSWNVGPRWLYTVCLAVIFYGGALWAVLRRRGPAASLLIPATVFAFGTWVITRQWGGDTGAGFLGLLLSLYFVTGVLFLRRYPHPTPGLIATTGGFFSWAAVWGIGLWAPGVISFFGAQSELWNVPKLFVAFGMIVMLLEEQSTEAQAASDRERAANVQLHRFAEVTSHLLSGVEVKDYCGRIAQVITEATTFMRVAIVLVNEDDRLFVAGHAGLEPDVLTRVQESIAEITVGAADELCRRGRVIGKTAVVIAPQEHFHPVRTTREYAPNPYWCAGDELSVPLISPRGKFLGLISLDDPREPEHVTADETSKIEMLAADIAVAIDHADMQRQLVTSEKLAGLGQLVRGMAHEMNNPLTAVLGYAELLGEQAKDEDIRRGLGVIHREAQRIRSIIANLRRFAQQDESQIRPIELLPILQTTIRQKAQEARSRGIEVVENFATALPQVIFDEAQVTQVILNVMNNALDAVENAPEKRVTVIVRAEDTRVVLSFIDSGPGFTNVDRVFDPFFTTKSPGKGTGLGLSICYGILRQHGGHITARNVQPTGACVTIELQAARRTSANA